MAVPTRPSAGAVVETAWGQVAHDTAVAMDVQTGSVNCSHSAAAASAVVTVTFPRPFAAPPVVVFSTINYNFSAAPDGNAPTAINCRVASYRISGIAYTGNVVVYWMAYGPRA